ncbi:MAG: hypothetical protein ABI668_00975 [Sphingorhabdus sp.]
MVLKAVIMDSSEAISLDAAVLDLLQWEQFEHDEKYHREIARLTVQDRLKHMALHFAKYAGELFAEPSEDKFRRLVTDTLIIGISAANTLNIRLADAVGQTDVGNPSDFDRQLVVAAGRMATACEKLDHLEDFPFRPHISAEVLKIINSSIAVFMDKQWDVTTSIKDRLAPVKAKSIFFGKL